MKILVIDDSPDKFSQIRESSEHHANGRPNQPRPTVVWAAPMVDQRATYHDAAMAISAQELAEYDIVLVDFNLETTRAFREAILAEVDLPAEDLGTLSQLRTETVPVEPTEIQITTGIGVMLRFTQLVATEEFRTARGDRRPPVHCMYGSRDETWVLFGAGLGALLFGARWIDASASGTIGRLIDELNGTGPADKGPAAVVPQAATEVLHKMLFPCDSRDNFNGWRWRGSPRANSGYMWLRHIQHRGVGVTAASLEQAQLVAGKRTNRAGTGDKEKVQRFNFTEMPFEMVIEPLYGYLQRFVSAMGKSALSDMKWPPIASVLREELRAQGLERKEIEPRTTKRRDEMLSLIQKVLHDSDEVWAPTVRGIPNDVEHALRWFRATRLSSSVVVAAEAQAAAEAAKRSRG